MRKRFLKICAMAAIVIAPLSAVAAPSAVAGGDACNSGQVCLYEHKDFGAMLGWRAPNVKLMNVSGNANDKMSSWKNRTSVNARWYQNANGGGFCRTMESWHEKAYVGYWDNDKLTSWATDGGC